VEDAEWDEILSMPPHSPWPFICALALTGVFAMLLLHHYWIALGFVMVGALVLFSWHRKEVEG
jgi:hypothetical protein